MSTGRTPTSNRTHLTDSLSAGLMDMVPTNSSGWLRNSRFDIGLIVGVLALALVAGGIANVSSRMFGAILFLDVWLLAYPHAAATYTRIAFDRTRAKRYWALLLPLPILVGLGTTSVLITTGVTGLNTLYFFWQSWHYTRQSYGIARIYGRRALWRPDTMSSVLVFAITVSGVLHRAHQHAGVFYGSPLWLPTVPQTLDVGVSIATFGLLAVWLLRSVIRIKTSKSTKTLGHTLFVLSHVIVTVVSYVVISDITEGWIFVNIWHNAQYLIFVWAMNTKRFEAGFDPKAAFLSRISQPDQWLRYALACAGLGIAFYLILGWTTHAIEPYWLHTVLVAHLAVNFHHYVVDAIIWRRPRTNAYSPAQRSLREF